MTRKSIKKLMTINYSRINGAVCQSLDDTPVNITGKYSHSGFYISQLFTSSCIVRIENFTAPRTRKLKKLAQFTRVSNKTYTSFLYLKLALIFLYRWF